MCERGVIDSLIDDKLAVQPRQDTASPDRAKTHNNEVVDNINAAVTKPRQRHEKTPVDFDRAGAEAWRDQHGTSRDKD